MTDNEQRIAIAEACGWERASKYDHLIDSCEIKMWAKDGRLASPDDYIHKLPDYLNDLNAMHEAEKTLTAAQSCMYYETVRIIIARDFNSVCGQVMTGLPCHDMTFINATARQRAKAFLRTVGRWKE